MIFLLQAQKEARREAEKDGAIYTAEFGMGYIMTKYPLQFIADILIDVFAVFGVLALCGITLR